MTLTDVQKSKEICVVQFQVTAFRKGFVLVVDDSAEYEEFLASGVFCGTFSPLRDMRKATEEECRKACVLLKPQAEAVVFGEDAYYCEPVGYFGNQSGFAACRLESEVETCGEQGVFGDHIDGVLDLVRDELDVATAFTDTATVSVATLWEFAVFYADEDPVGATWELLGELDIEKLCVKEKW